MTTSNYKIFFIWIISIVLIVELYRLNYIWYPPFQTRKLDFVKLRDFIRYDCRNKTLIGKNQIKYLLFYIY